MSWDPIFISIFIISVLGAILNALFLLITPYHHPIAIAAIVSGLLRCVTVILPVVVHDKLDFQFSIPDHEFWSVAIGGKELSAETTARLAQNTPLSRFCTAQATTMYYALAVKYAFLISLTFPILRIAYDSSRQLSRPDMPPLANQWWRRVHGDRILAFTPFIWGLPLLVMHIPRLLHEAGKEAIIYFRFFTCDMFNDQSYLTVSIVLMGVPLVVGVIISILVLVFVWRLYSRQLCVLSSSILDVALLNRFALTTAVIFGSVLLHIVLLATESHPVYYISIYYEALTPLIVFFLFVSQRRILDTWYSRFARIFKHRRRSRDAPSRKAGDSDSLPDDTFPQTMLPELKKPRFRLLCFRWEREDGDMVGDEGAGGNHLRRMPDGSLPSSVNALAVKINQSADSSSTDFREDSSTYKSHVRLDSGSVSESATKVQSPPTKNGPQIAPWGSLSPLVASQQDESYLEFASVARSASLSTQTTYMSDFGSTRVRRPSDPPALAADDRILSSSPSRGTLSRSFAGNAHALAPAPSSPPGRRSARALTGRPTSTFSRPSTGESLSPMRSSFLPSMSEVPDMIPMHEVGHKHSKSSPPFLEEQDLGTYSAHRERTFGPATSEHVWDADSMFELPSSGLSQRVSEAPPSPPWKTPPVPPISSAHTDTPRQRPASPTTSIGTFGGGSRRGSPVSWQEA